MGGLIPLKGAWVRAFKDVVTDPKRGALLGLVCHARFDRPDACTPLLHLPAFHDRAEMPLPL